MNRPASDEGSSSQPASEGAPTTLGVEFGWRSHSAIQAWTSSVDSKASIVLVVEVAVLGAASKSFFGRAGQLHAMNGTGATAAAISVVVLGLAVALALGTVYPSLKRKALAAAPGDGLIYFGHLKDRSANEIKRALIGITPDEELSQLAAQLAVTSSIAWKKHARLQASLLVFGIGVIALMTTLAAA